MRTFVHQHLPSTLVRASAAPILAHDAAALWTAVFDNDRPVRIEVGPGRGEFLLHTAREDPEHNYFAIERSRGRTRDIEKRLGKRPDLSNARVVNGDAACVLALLPDASVDGYYVLFPDPWWKIRHHRRRLLTPEFVATLRRTLVVGGAIQMATDVLGYFEVAQQYLDADPGLERKESGVSASPSTSFSRKAERAGAVTYRSVHGKIAMTATRCIDVAVYDPTNISYFQRASALEISNLSELSMREPATSVDAYPPVTDALLAEVVRRIRAAGTPHAVVLFGSRARGDARPDSDLDILIIERSTLPRFKRSARYRRALRGIFPAKDVVVWTPDEIAEWQNVPNAFITSVLAEGRVLYEG